MAASSDRRRVPADRIGSLRRSRREARRDQRRARWLIKRWLVGILQGGQPVDERDMLQRDHAVSSGLAELPGRPQQARQPYLPAVRYDHRSRSATSQPPGPAGQLHAMPHSMMSRAAERPMKSATVIGTCCCRYRSCPASSSRTWLTGGTRLAARLPASASVAGGRGRDRLFHPVRRAGLSLAPSAPPRPLSVTPAAGGTRVHTIRSSTGTPRGPAAPAHGDTSRPAAPRSGREHAGHPRRRRPWRRRAEASCPASATVNVHPDPTVPRAARHGDRDLPADRVAAHAGDGPGRGTERRPPLGRLNPSTSIDWLHTSAGAIV